MGSSKRVISAIILAKNEAQRIAACIQSLSWVDEIIVIDNCSTDETVGIAKKYKVQVIETETYNFAEMRNLGKDAAIGEWILYVDADERVTPELQHEIQSLISSSHPAKSDNVYRIRRQNYYLGNHLWPHEDILERLFRKTALQTWYGEVHESPKTVGAVGDLQGALQHFTHRNLSEMISKTNEWSEIEAKLRYKTNHPVVVWWRLFRVIITGFWDSFIRQDGYRAGTVGWIESLYQGFSLFITYAKLWEMQQNEKKHESL
jgi:glycosyltransferase involved in cell wall biosynthesis